MILGESVVLDSNNFERILVTKKNFNLSAKPIVSLSIIVYRVQGTRAGTPKLQRCVCQDVRML